MLYVDMDGVVADFDAHYENHFGARAARWPAKETTDWSRVRAVPNFFRTIPLMPDARVLLNAIKDRPFAMLTGVPREVDTSSNEKIDWVRITVDPIVGRKVDVICCRAREKCLHGKPGDKLIDDYLKYRDLWIAMGGLFIHHTSAVESVRQLKELELTKQNA